MIFDPFTSQKPKPVIKRQPQNFVEALKSVGGHTSQPINDENLASLDYLKSSEENWPSYQEKALRRHQEVLNATPLYDRREEEVKAQIKALQDELKALAKDLANLSLTTQKALDEEIASPGHYHVSFFEKLRHFIINLRKQVANANNWLELSYARRKSKQYYWSGVQKGGTKFMLSQERYMATSAG